MFPFLSGELDEDDGDIKDKAAPTLPVPFRQRFLHWRRSAATPINSLSPSEDADTSDHSVHQCIAKDDARDPMSSDDNEVDAAQNAAERSEGDIS